MAWVNVFNTVFHDLVKDPFISTRQFALQNSFSLVYKSTDPCQSISGVTRVVIYINLFQV